MDMNDKIWNPWHGCHKCSEGCQNCYAYFLDKRYGRDTDEVVKNKSGFNLPVKRDKAGNYKLESGSFVRVCMTSDFFVEESDAWRDEAWEIIRRRPDVVFSLLTKRAQRIREQFTPEGPQGRRLWRPNGNPRTVRNSIAKGHRCASATAYSPLIAKNSAQQIAFQYAKAEQEGSS